MKPILLFLLLLLCGARLPAREVILEWDPQPAENQTVKYCLYEQVAGEWHKLGEVNADAASLSFSAGDRTPGVYTFKVTATNYWGEADIYAPVTTAAPVPGNPGGGSLRIQGAKKLALESSTDLQKWDVVAEIEVPEEDRVFYRVQFAD